MKLKFSSGGAVRVHALLTEGPERKLTMPERKLQEAVSLSWGEPGPCVVGERQVRKEDEEVEW